jgi:hypothetical protein
MSAAFAMKRVTVKQELLDSGDELDRLVKSECNSSENWDRGM